MSLTLRQQAAIAALQGMLASPGSVYPVSGDRERLYARRAIEFADALIAELESTPARADFIAAQDVIIKRQEKEIAALRADSTRLTWLIESANGGTLPTQEELIDLAEIEACDEFANPDDYQANARAALDRLRETKP